MGQWFVGIYVSCLIAASLAATSSNASELAGTSWQLVNVTSMDERMDVPDQPSNYTLAFQPDGSGLSVQYRAISFGVYP